MKILVIQLLTLLFLIFKTLKVIIIGKLIRKIQNSINILNGKLENLKNDIHLKMNFIH